MAIDIVNCKKCGRLFQSTSSRRICPECEKALEEKFVEVREYIRDNPGASMMQVSQEKEVAVEQIKQWVREERLLFTNAESSGIECLSCGVPIATGKYCPKCKEQMAHKLENAYDKPKPVLKPQTSQASSKGKMRFIGQDDKR